MTKYALISVSDKAGIQDFAQSLAQNHGYTILSTGGTAKVLRDAGIVVTDVSEYTDFPEMLDGRVKTLHPKIHAGLLAKRNNRSHQSQAESAGIQMIDLVAVNLYPFQQTIARPGCSLEDAIENIDIGGPSMLRSAAKNHASVTVVCDPSDYSTVLQHINDNEIHSLRKQLALKAFSHTSDYDSAISSYLSTQQDEPNIGNISGFEDPWSPEPIKKAMTLRYGENPHQQAALYGSFFDTFKQLQGKELSYNNILDISSAAYLIGEFEKPTISILKHTNPCGVASASSIEEAWANALATDRKSPFGGIIVSNRTITPELASELADLFCEVIIAPAFSEEALAILGKKKNLRLMVADQIDGPSNLMEVRSVIGGFLLQDRDFKPAHYAQLNVVTERQPTPEEWESLLFGWRVVKHVKSNAIVYAQSERTLGIGAGQMSRIDASNIAVRKAQESGLSLEGSIIASDAFFPFPDALETAANAGATAAIQPGGSKGDEAVIQAANENNMAMVFTQKRHFKH